MRLDGNALGRTVAGRPRMSEANKIIARLSVSVSPRCPPGLIHRLQIPRLHGRSHGRRVAIHALALIAGGKKKNTNRSAKCWAATCDRRFSRPVSPRTRNAAKGGAETSMPLFGYDNVIFRALFCLGRASGKGESTNCFGTGWRSRERPAGKTLGAEAEIGLGWR